MQKVLIYVQAFNAEKYIKKALDSISRQINPNFICWVCDNGSTDGTAKIIRKHITEDSRFSLFYVKKNDTRILYKEYLPKLMQEADTNNIKWFCNLDADDQYKPEFLSKLIYFMQQNNLDCAACGSDFISGETLKLIGQRCIKKNLILQDQDFNVYFPIYHQYMRTIWGKIFTIDLLRKCNFQFSHNIEYGIDSLTTMKAFYHAERVGILSGTLHKYYISPKSVSHQFDEKRIRADQVVAFETERYLLNKCGSVSPNNCIFLRMVYLNAIKDTFSVLIKSQEPVLTKLQLLVQILGSRYSLDLFTWNGGGEEKKSLSMMFISWIMNQKESYTIAVDTATEAMALLGAAPDGIPRQYTDAQKFVFLARLCFHWRGESVPEVIDKQILSLIDGDLLLKQFDLSFCLYFQEICSHVLDSRFTDALRRIQEIVEGEQDIPQEYVLSLFSLAVNLAAKLEDMESFIYFKKIYISLLLDFSQTETAKEELADWDTILPEDLDFKKLRKRIDL